MRESKARGDFGVLLETETTQLRRVDLLRSTCWRAARPRARGMSPRSNASQCCSSRAGNRRHDRLAAHALAPHQQ